MNDKDIAIVGMACVWPGARDLGQYWSNLVNGVDGIGEPPDGRWRYHRNFDPANGHEVSLPGKRCGFLPTDLIYDPMRHRVLPNLVLFGDADQFLMLDIIDRALQDARVADDDPVRRRTDVIIGRGNYTTGKLNEMALRGELIDTLLTLLGWQMPDVFDARRRQEIEALLRGSLTPRGTDTVSTGVPNLVASRTANRLNLRGTAYTVDAACASSLLAVEQATWRLRNGQCDLAVAAGLFLCLTPTFLGVFGGLGALSPSQMIRPFDRRADGLLAGEGGGAVILKRLADAQRDGDPIYAILKGVGSASDGKEVDVLAPAVAGQLQALEIAYADAGIDRDTIGFLEAHGTATAAGDLTEIATIRKFFGTSRAAATARAMGSVKSMIGHTMPAAGMASLIKMALALSNRIMPPSLHCEEPRPELEDAPFYLLTQTRPWFHNPARGPRRGAINAFGFGGINAHVVLEEVAEPVTGRRSQVSVPGHTSTLNGRPFSAVRRRPTELLAFAAPSNQDLIEQLVGLESFLDKDGTAATLADVAATLARAVDVGKAVKLALVCADLPRLRELLRDCREQLTATGVARPAEGVWFSNRAATHEGKVACVIPGMGVPGLTGNYPEHLLELCLHYPELRAEFDLFEDRDGHPEDPVPTSLVFAPPPHLPGETRRALKARLAPPRNDDPLQKQPTPARRALPGVGVTLSNWLSWSLFRKFAAPVDMITGQSMGETIAASAAGLCDFHEILPTYWKTLTLGSGVEAGAVLAFVHAPAEKIEPLLARYPGTYVAVYAAPDMMLLGGMREDLEAMLAVLQRDGALASLLPYPAVHTPHQNQFHAPFATLFPEGERVFGKRQMEIYSSITADKFPEDAAAIAEVMRMNIDRPLRIWQTVRKMYGDGARVFVQLGCANQGAVEKLLPEGAQAVTAALDSPECHPLTQLNNLAATLFTAGVPIRLAPLYELRPVRELDLAAPQAAPARPALAIPLRTSWDLLVTHQPAELPSRSDGRPACRAVPAQPTSEPPVATATEQAPPFDPNLPILGKVVEFTPGQRLVLEHRLSLDEDLYLHDHLFVVSAPKPAAERVPTVPLTFSMEFAAEAASLLAPEQTLIGFEDVRGRRWVQPRPGVDVLRVEATLHSDDPETQVRRLNVELSLGGHQCFTATALFAPSYRHDLEQPVAAPASGEPWPFAMAEVYGERILFHGPRLQGVTGLGEIAGPLATVKLTVLPRNDLFASRPQPRLLTDPALMDAMGASFGMWAYTFGHTIMPIGVEKVEFYGPPPPVGASLELRIEVTEFNTETRQARCNMDLVDEHGHTLVRARGWADWLLNWSYEFSLCSRLPQQHTLAQQLDLPGLPEGAVCSLLRGRDVVSVGREWLVCMFLHSDEVAALRPEDEERRGFLYSRAAVKDAVRSWWAQRHGGPMPHPSEFRLAHDDAGRPYLEPAGDPDLPFVSCAHSEGTYVALASDVPVGVDLEPISRDARAILPDFATADEIALLGQLEAVCVQENWATRLWCAKEAVSKAQGTGLQGRPKHFVALDGDADGRLLIEHVPTGRRFVICTTRVRDFILAYTSEELPVEPSAAVTSAEG
jgi:acyl transferase domain-containing protein